MRLEDKELEGPTLEHDQSLEVLEDQTFENDRKLPEHATNTHEDLELEHRSRVLDAVQAILARQNLSVPQLYLPQRESLALEALQSAVTGRNRSMGTFVYAEDRGALLEQALSVLQQNLTLGDAATLTALHSKYEELMTNVAEIREQLLDLEDAQDDLLEIDELRNLVKGTPDTTDSETDADDSVTGFIASALDALAHVAQVDEATPMFRSTLVGPDLPETAKPASTLDGPAPALEPKPTSLTGPDLPAAATHVSTLDAPGPEVPNKPDHVIALDGPDRPAEQKRSQLYTEGMAELLVPEHLRPRTAADQPTGMRTDQYLDPAEREAQRQRQREEEAAAQAAREAEAAAAKAATAARAAAAAAAAAKSTAKRDSKRDSSRDMRSTETGDEPPSRPTPKPRGLSVRSTEKPGNKK